MTNQELSSEEMNMFVGNITLQQLITTATNLFEKGYSKEEVENVLSKTFDLSNVTLRRGFESLCSQYMSSQVTKTSLTR